MRKSLTVLLCATALVAAAADRRAPGFDLIDSRGVWHDLADYRGKLVLLAFIQSTCPHCAMFAENLEQARQKYGDKIAVIAVVNPPDDVSKVNAFIAGHNIGFPIIFDSGQMAFSYVLNPTLKFPRLFMIDAEGIIRADDEYSPLTREIFEGNALGPAIFRLLNGAPKK